MPRALLAAACAAAIGATAHAAVAPCPTTVAADLPAQVTLQDYINLGSCQIGDKVFSNFQDRFFPNGTATAQNTAQFIRVYVLNPGTLSPGFRFFATNSNWSVANGNDNQESIFYTVTVVNGGAAINDATLSNTGLVPEGAGSQYSISETLTGVTVLRNFENPAANPPFRTSDTRNFDPVMMVNVNNQISLTAGAGGTAQFTSFINLFSEVPEPASWSMFIAGAFAIGAFARARRRRLTLAV